MNFLYYASSSDVLLYYITKFYNIASSSLIIIYYKERCNTHLELKLMIDYLTIQSKRINLLCGVSL